MNAIWRGLAAAALGLAAAAAQAGGINWSIGINLPPVSTVISNDSYHRPYYAPAPVYVAPPVVYQPAPVYHAPPVYHVPPPVYYRPVPIAVAPAYIVERRYGPPRHEWHHHRGHGHDHRWHGRGHRDDRGHHNRRWRDDD